MAIIFSLQRNPVENGQKVIELLPLRFNWLWSAWGGVKWGDWLANYATEVGVFSNGNAHVRCGNSSLSPLHIAHVHVHVSDASRLATFAKKGGVQPLCQPNQPPTSFTTISFFSFSGTEKTFMILKLALNELQYFQITLLHGRTKLKGLDAKLFVFYIS